MQNFEAKQTSKCSPQCPPDIRIEKTNISAFTGKKSTSYLFCQYFSSTNVYSLKIAGFSAIYWPPWLGVYCQLHPRGSFSHKNESSLRLLKNILFYASYNANFFSSLLPVCIEDFTYPSWCVTMHRKFQKHMKSKILFEHQKFLIVF